MRVQYMNYIYYGKDEETIMEMSDELLKVEWENIGEGYRGDYDPEDPEDDNFLRFSVYVKNEEGDWEEVDDATYCTYNSIDTPEKDLKSMLKTIFDEYRDVITEYPVDVSVKKLGERLSHIEPEVQTRVNEKELDER